MKVLHINGNYISTALHQTMIEHLDREDVNSTIIIPNNGVDQPVVELNSNATVLNCFSEIDRFFFHRKQKKIIAEIEKNYSICDYDIIHAYTLFTDGYTAMKLAEKYNKPFVVAVRNTDLNIFFRYMIWLRKTGITVLKKASQIFFLSKSYQNKLFDMYVPQKIKDSILGKTMIIPNGIDDFWFENIGYPKALTPGRIKLTYAGRLDRNKNVITSIEVVEILSKRGYDVSLDIAGKIVDSKTAKKIQNNRYIHYHGVIKKNELINLYRSGDIFLMPSYTETFGLVYAEAMSQGLPVIYTKGQGFDNQFDNGVVGFAVSPCDPNEIADNIEKIVNNYVEISKQAIFNVQRYRWDKISRLYHEIYMAVVDKRKHD